MTFPYIIHDLIWDYCIKMPHCCSVGSASHINSDKDIKSTSRAIFSSNWNKKKNDPESSLLTYKLYSHQKEEEWLVSWQTRNHLLNDHLKTRAVVGTAAHSALHALIERHCGKQHSASCVCCTGVITLLHKWQWKTVVTRCRAMLTVVQIIIIYSFTVSLQNTDIVCLWNVLYLEQNTVLNAGEHGALNL